LNSAGSLPENIYPDSGTIANMTASRSVWLALVVLIALDLIVPWGIIGGQATFAGPFLFWVIWTACAIVGMFLVFARWRE